MTDIILEVNIKNLIKNYKEIKRTLNKTTSIGAVVKSNAYGLGIKKISKILNNIGCKYFYVATIEEGIELRKLLFNVNIYVLNGLRKNQIKLFYQYNLIPVINSLEEYNIIKKHNKIKKINIHFDTGMNRLGMNFKDMVTLSKQIYKSNIYIDHIISHLSSSERRKDNFNRIQIKEFKKIISIFPKTKLSIANSAGIFLSKKFNFDQVRPGISLYGGYGNNYIRKRINNVIKLKAKIIQIKKVNKHETIGYNQTYTLKSDKKVATISAGYADGIPRILSNKSYVYFKKQKLKILGRISMDTFMVDINNIKKSIEIGDFVEIINNKMDIEKFAKIADTVSQDILTSFGNRISIKYL